MADYETDLIASRTAEADAAVADILKEIGAAPPAEPAAAAPVTPAGDPPPPAEAAKPAEPQDTDRGMLRLLEREGTVRDRESAIEKREAEVNRKLLEMESRLGAPRDPADIRKAIELDPIKFFTEAGIEPEQVSRLILSHKLGDKAPAEIREATKGYQVRKELEELRGMIHQRDLQLEVERVRNGAQGFLDTGEQVSKYPALGAVAKVDRKMAADAILEEIGRDAQERKVPLGGQYLTHEEAAKRVESRWAVFQKAFVPASASTNTPPPAAPESKGATVNNTNPPPAPRSAPPRKLTPYWEDSNWEAAKESALAEAMAEYSRVAR
jgi:hypothetical protein